MPARTHACMRARTHALGGKATLTAAAADDIPAHRTRTRMRRDAGCTCTVCTCMAAVQWQRLEFEWM
jgi:hypothetical protein